MSTDIVALISSVGFPIVACIAMAIYVNTTVKELTKTIAQNTLVLEKLLTKLDVDDVAKN